jgi:hypothetical protein
VTHVLIIEPYESGHHATYLRWTIEAIVERGWTAIVATTAPTLEHPELRAVRHAPGVQIRLIGRLPPEPGVSPACR